MVAAGAVAAGRKRVADSVSVVDVVVDELEGQSRRVLVRYAERKVLCVIGPVLAVVRFLVLFKG